MFPVVQLERVSVVRGGRTILDKIDWRVDSDQRWVIIGPNGAGKTTLLRVAAAQIHPSSGVAKILGQTLGAVNVFELRTRIGFASSAMAAQIPNSESVLDAVMTASYGITGRWKEVYEAPDEARARQVLGLWKLADLAERPFGTLSDGERKRVQIARAVMADPELMLLDEPVASLDLAAREQTIRLLGDFAQSKAAPAIAMVTHHLEEVPEGFTHAMLLSEGKIVAAGAIDKVITDAKVSEAFKFELRVQKHAGRFQVSVG